MRNRNIWGQQFFWKLSYWPLKMIRTRPFFGRKNPPALRKCIQSFSMNEIAAALDIHRTNERHRTESARPDPKHRSQRFTPANPAEQGLPYSMRWAHLFRNFRAKSALPSCSGQKDAAQQREAASRRSDLRRGKELLDIGEHDDLLQLWIDFG